MISLTWAVTLPWVYNPQLTMSRGALSPATQECTGLGNIGIIMYIMYAV